MTSTITKKWVSVRNTEGKHQHIAHWDTIIFNGNRSLIRSWLFVLTSVHIWQTSIYWKHLKSHWLLSDSQEILCSSHVMLWTSIEFALDSLINCTSQQHWLPSSIWTFSTVLTIFECRLHFGGYICSMCVCAYTLVTTMATHWPSVWTASYPRVNFAFTFSMTTTQTQTGHCHMVHCVCVSVYARRSKLVLQTVMFVNHYKQKK